MFKIHMLPAEYGDCLWVEYGKRGAVHRMLVDAGTASTWPTLKKKLEALPEDDRTFELLVVTHIDVDHIGGVLPLLKNAEALGVTFKDVWFNGYTHLARATDVLGAIQGETLSALLTKRGDPWNAAFDGEPIVVRDRKPLPHAPLAGGMKITILSPGREQMEKLLPVWEKTVKDAGLVPGVEARRDPDEMEDLLGALDVDTLAASRFKSDTAEPNGSSIAFVATFDTRSVLFGADAHPGVLLENLKRMKKEDRERISVLKLPHHGSRANLSSDLLEAVPCRTFLVSTNGKKFSHPNPEAIARAVYCGKGARLKFNYRTTFNKDWDNSTLMKRYGYDVEYGDKDGLVVDCTKR